MDSEQFRFAKLLTVPVFPVSNLPDQQAGCPCAADRAWPRRHRAQQRYRAVDPMSVPPSD